MAIIGKVLKQYKEELSFLKAGTDKYAEIKQGAEILAAYLPRQLTRKKSVKRWMSCSMNCRPSSATCAP